MSKARLTKIGLRNFKSFGPDYQEIELKPLTVLVGRNNSGKSSIIQSLLLLKQTLEHPRPEVQLLLEGYVDALGLRELTHGWPEGDIVENGPAFTLEWESLTGPHSTTIGSLKKDLEHLKLPKQEYQAALSIFERGNQWSKLALEYIETNSRIIASNISLTTGQPPTYAQAPPSQVRVSWNRKDRRHQIDWAPRTNDAKDVNVSFENFLPYVQHTNDLVSDVVYRYFYGGPLEEFKSILLRLNHLGASRVMPPSIYRPTTAPPDDVGISGEYAAQVLHARRSERVHFLPLPELRDDGHISELPSTVYSLPLVDAVNQIFHALGAATEFKIEDIQNVGFRLLYGKSSLQHVGRGISYLLPLVISGLIADPLRSTESMYDMSLDAYLDLCPAISHITMEEPESHLHPKVQTLLVHFMISMARSGRQMIVETHSDHLVRRLRYLIARAAPGSEAERWLRENVNIVEVEQSPEGVTTLHPSTLTPTGSIAEHWPADFMDVASNEERAIYLAAMEKEEEKPPAEEEYAARTEFVEGRDDDET